MSGTRPPVMTYFTTAPPRQSDVTLAVFVGGHIVEVAVPAGTTQHQAATLIADAINRVPPRR